MKDWLVCAIGQGDYWLTRIDTLANGRETYLCGACDGPLVDSVVAFFASSRGSAGCLGCGRLWAD